jgi:dihydrofolate synthase/folylpolyglutamate synthase
MLEQTLDYLYGLQHIGIKLGLRNITTLLKLLDQPQNRFASVHIAGTNGKGSTAAFLSSILQAAGYKVGLYTSPHLIDFTERIKVNGEAIPAFEVVRLTSTIKRLIDNHPDFSPPGGAHPTFFEVTTALAFSHFADAGVDIAVVETGMGGRLDATNVLNPLVSIITNIGLEHQQYLGHTLGEIAGEKAGIIKPKGMVLSGVEGVEAQAVIKRECRARQASLYTLKPGFDWRLKAGNLEAQCFDLHTPQGDYKDLCIRLLGDFQLGNAALAVGAVELLGRQGLTVTESAVRRGLATAGWEGRLQLVSRRPYMVLDGAHNPQAARALAAELPKLFKYNTLILVLGVLEDKDVAGMLNEWLDMADIFVLTRPDSDRAADPQFLLQSICPRNHGRVVIKKSIARALDHARDLAEPADLICVTGSLYTVGEALAVLRGREGRRRRSRQ